MNDVGHLLVDPTTRIGEAMQILDTTGTTILLLVDEQRRLRRTVTDGDLRRLLMKGATLETQLADLPALRSTVVDETAGPSQALEVMNRLQIDQLPVVDTQQRPVRLFLRRDLDTQILLSTPHMGDEEREFIDAAFKTNWIAPLGPNVEAFEREVADYVGAKHAAALVSGTAAIHLSLRLLDVKPGDVIFCSSFTFAATANPILYERAIPVFIDSEPGSWNMSPLALAEAFRAAEQSGQLPRAVIVVNLYGQSADLDALRTITDRYGVPLIEDAAESLGATYKGRQSGTFGLMGIYSFNGNKIITTSGGGMLVADDKDLVDRARFLATQARDPVPSPYYHHSQVGYNYRLSNVLAGIGRGQLRVLEERVRRRREIFETYRRELADVPAISWMPEAPFGRSTRWLSAALLDPQKTDLTPTVLIRALAKEKIEARHVWKPLHQQPVFANFAYFSHSAGISVCDDLFLRGVCLPSGSNLTTDQQQRIVRILRSLLDGGH